MSPAWRFGIGPLFLRLPDDLEVVGAYTGRMTTYADRGTSAFYPPGREVTTHLRIESRDAAVPELSDRKVLVLEEKVSVRDAATGELLEGLRPETMYALDRASSENVPGFIDGIDRRGFTVKLPMRTGRKSYAVWDDDLATSITCRFIREGVFDPGDGAPLRVLVFRLGGTMEKMARPPPGVPAAITGREAKALTGNPELPVAEDRLIELDYYKKTDAVWYVEPQTGTTVYVPRHRYSYYVKNAPGGFPPYRKLAEVEYSKDTSGDDFASTRKYARLIHLEMRALPFLFLTLGAAALASGAYLRRRGKRRDPGRGGARSD